MKTFTIGDLHGNYKALKQCLERASFDKENDTLIQLGDVCDGWNYVRDCVDELLTIKNLIAIKGNHDDWMNDFLLYGVHAVDWAQGGLGTLKSYATAETRWEKGKTPPNGWSREAAQEDYGYITNLNYSDIPKEHVEFFNHQLLYYIDDERNLFIHGGFNRHFPLKEQAPYIYYWDRDLFMCALSAKAGGTKLKFKEEFKNIFIGHTTTLKWKSSTPIFADKLINLDTGAGGKEGRLTIMNVETKEYFQSDKGIELYPEEEGRTNI